MKKRENYFFLFLLAIVYAFSSFTFIKTEVPDSKAENRSLATFPHFTLHSFLDGSFQDNFENALSDQFVFSEDIRIGYANAIKSIPTFNIEDSVCKNHYLELANSVNRRRGTFDCDDYMLYYPEPLDNEETIIVNENIAKYNRVNTLSNTFYYLINDSSVYDFEKNEKVVDYNKILKENLSGNYKLASLDFNNYDEFKKYFYKTDHHWNYNGSYKGYTDIARLLNIKKINQPIELFTNHEYFFGSHAQNTKNYDIQEEFSFYRFNFVKNHSTLINGQPETYGHYEDYIAHKYEYDKTTNYYAYLYGTDYGEIIYDYHQPEKENLLIISNSYSNAINQLIAENFNKTYIIDLRFYKDAFNQDFSFSKYLKDHGVNKTLIILSPTFLRERNTNQGLEL